MFQILKNKIGKIKPIHIYTVLFFFFLLSLSYFRDFIRDENYYLQEVVLMSNLLKDGLWIGDYGVGLHGFLFKLPVAILFILIGRPSIFLATLYTIILSVICVILFYKFIRKYFFSDKYSLLTTILFSTSLYFLNASVSFYRDIPVLLTVLIFLHLLFNKSSKWLIGISLLLMLDAKEYVFFIVALAYAIYLFWDSILFTKGKNRLLKFKEFISNSFAAFILPFIFILLMLTTSLVPINIYIPSILGLTTVGQEWNTSQFSFEKASSNLAGPGARVMPRLQANQNIDDFIKEQEINDNVFLDIVVIGIKGIDIIFGYIGKMLYPRSFSYISIAKIVVAPAFCMAFILLKRWRKEKKREEIFLSIYTFVFFLIYLLRASHGRYLLPLSPVLFLFLAIFLKEYISKKKIAFKVLLFTSIFSLLGLYFEMVYLEIKIVMDLSLLAILWILYFTSQKDFKYTAHLKVIFFVILATFQLGTMLMFSYSIGQISQYLKWGRNREIDKVVENIEEDSIIWINDIGWDILPLVIRENLYIYPTWIWELDSRVPKSALLKTYGEQNTYQFNLVDLNEFKNNIKEYSIDEVVLIVSEIDDIEFSNQESLDILLTQDWLVLENRVQLKNKVMYVFDVKD